MFTLSPLLRKDTEGHQGGAAGVEAHVPDDLGEGRHLEVVAGELRFPARY